MDMPDLDYHTMTPYYVAREHYHKYALTADDKELLRRAPHALFKEHLASQSPDYQRYIFDFDENNHEEVPLLVSSLDLRADNPTAEEITTCSSTPCLI